MRRFRRKVQSGRERSCLGCASGRKIGIDLEGATTAYDEEFATLLDSLEASLPLAEASDLSREPLAQIIHDLSEGLIGEVVEIVTRAAVAAISRGEDRITGATLSDLGYVPLSRRRNSALRHEMT